MIRFYTNVTNELYANPAIFTAGAVYARLLPASYVFNANHTLAQIPSGLSNGEMLYLKAAYEVDGLKAFSSTAVDLGVIPSGVSYNSVVFYSNLKPLFIISDIPGLPGVGNNGMVNISFSSSENKMFRLSSAGDIYEGANFTYAKFAAKPPEEPLGLTRPGGNVGLEFASKPKPGKSSMYSDLSFRGGAHPLTGDILTVYGESAINRSIRNIIMTNTGDRPFSSRNVAGNVKAWLFEPGGTLTINSMIDSITNSIINFEPRVDLYSVDVIENPAENGVDIRIAYSIKTTNVTEAFSLFLERA